MYEVYLGILPYVMLGMSILNILFSRVFFDHFFFLPIFFRTYYNRVNHQLVCSHLSGVSLFNQSVDQ